MLLRRPRAVVDVVDETYVRAAPQVVREALDAPGLLEGLWPGLERQVVQDRGAKGVRWRVRGEVEGLDAAGFEQAAQAAKAGCPVSKALTGVDITLDAALEG